VLRARAICAGLVLLLVAHLAAAAPIPLLDSGIAGFVGQAQQGPLDQPVLVNSYSEFLATFGASTAGLANPYLAPSVAAFFVNGGQHLYVVRTAGADDASLIGIDVPGARTGLQALRDAGAVAIVAIPGATSPAVQSALIAECESMGNRIAILDAVSATDINAVTAQHAGLASVDGYAALYFPWVQAAPAGVSLLLPPSGFVAGVYARSTPPTSPAGTTAGALLSATDVSLALNTTQLSQLNALNIDTIRNLVAQGVVAWGARTLASNTEYQYVAVRREGSAIVSSILAGTAWCLSQPNDATLWTQLALDTNDFMMGLFTAGWFKGSTPPQAFFTKCDASTMTAGDIAAGSTIMLIGFAPITPANFVIGRIVQQRPPAASVAPRPPAFALSAPRPNPFGPRMTIAFDLPAAAAVTLQVHDVGGRRVRTLTAGEVMAAGHHARSWDGRDDAGETLPAGVYLLQVRAGDRVLTRRVSLVR
jgi:phage tail sheath protein FI